MDGEIDVQTPLKTLREQVISEDLLQVVLAHTQFAR